jgi:hypothetical protein
MKVTPIKFCKQACPPEKASGQCECDHRRAEAGSESNIHKASFIERRLFYLKIKLLGHSLVQNSNALCFNFGADFAPGDSAVQLCYKGMQ